MRVSQKSSPNQSRLARLPVFYGWVILGVCALGMFTSGPGQTFGISIFVDPLINDLGWSRSMVSGLYTAGSLTAALAMIPVGRLLDRYGARVMLVAVALVFGVVALGMSQVNHPVHLFLGFAGLRILGQGSLTLIPTTLVAQWFVRIRGRAMALSMLGSVASQAAFPILILFLIISFGWRDAWVALAFIIWALLILPAGLLVRRNPESVGLLPDGDSPRPKSTESRVAEVPSYTDDWTASEAVGTRTFWLLLFTSSSQSLISTGLVFHMVSLLDSRGLSVTVTATVFSFMAISALLGTFVAGLLADRIPNRFLLTTGQGILVIAMLWMFVISAAWHAYLFGAMLGLAGRLTMVTSAVIWPNYYGRKYLGSIRGMVSTSGVASAALGPWPFGFLYDLTGTYATPVLVFLALPAACAVAAVLARPPRRGSVRTQVTHLR